MKYAQTKLFDNMNYTQIEWVRQNWVSKTKSFDNMKYTNLYNFFQNLFAFWIFS